MATELLYATSHIAGDFPNPGNALANTPTTWAGVLNSNTNYTSRYALGDPGEALTPGATQTVRVFCRKGTNSNVPSLIVSLYENGVLVQAGAPVNVTWTASQAVSITFTDALITNPNNVEIEVAQTSAGGSPSARNTAQISHLEWTADTTVTTESYSGSGLLSGKGNLSSVGSKTSTDSVILSGGGVLSSTGTKGVSGPALISGGGVLSSTGTKGVSGPSLISGGGVLSSTGTKGVSGPSLISGGGVLSSTGTKGGSEPTVTITDDFESLAPGDPLSDDTDWDVNIASGTGIPTMDQHDDHSDLSQVVDMSTEGDAYAIHQTQVGADDHYAELDVFVDTGPNHSNHLGPIARGSAAAHSASFDGYGAFAYAQTGGISDRWYLGIFRIDNGVPTQLTGTGDLGPAGTGDVDVNTHQLVRLDVSGSTLTAYIDGTQFLQTTDSTYTTGQYVGFRHYRENSAIASQPFVDNFEAASTTPPPTGITGSAVLSGKGTLTSSGVKSTSKSAVLSGKGTLTSSGVKSTSKSAGLSGKGTLTSSGVKSTSKSAVLSGKGTLTSSGVKSVSGSSLISGGGTLTTSGTAVITISGSAVLSGKGTLTSSGVKSTSGSSLISTNGLSSSTGVKSTSGSSLISGAGALTAFGIVATTISGSGRVSGNGSLTFVGYVSRQGTISLTGGGTLTVPGTKSTSGSVGISAGGNLSASGVGAVSLSGSGILSGGGVLSALGLTSRFGSVQISGGGTIAAEVVLIEKTLQIEFAQAQSLHTNPSRIIRGLAPAKIEVTEFMSPQRLVKQLETIKRVDIQLLPARR